MLEVLKMSQVKSKASRSYTRHSADYKKEALRLAEVHGVSKAASDLKLPDYPSCSASLARRIGIGGVRNAI